MWCASIFHTATFAGHKAVIEKVRAAERTTGRHVAIMADLPGPKMRIGQLAEEPIELRRRRPFYFDIRGYYRQWVGSGSR